MSQLEQQNKESDRAPKKSTKKYQERKIIELNREIAQLRQQKVALSN